MKRRTLHAGFALLALASAAAALLQGLQWRQRLQLNEALLAASRAPLAAAAALGPGSAAATGSPPAGAQGDEPAELLLARATALARAGADDAAFKLYSRVIAAGPQDPTARHALYNLGNLYLRQALGLQAQRGAATGATAAATASADRAPLVELAKQRYRDLLRAQPGDWDARYNLERALRLAPEEHAATPDESQTPVERRQVMLRGMEAGDLP